MDQYEFDFVSLDTYRDRSGLERSKAALNERGKESWALVGIDGGTAWLMRLKPKVTPKKATPRKTK